MKRFLERYRYTLILLRELVITDFKLRYQSSILGYVWSLLRPLALFGILYFVFVVFLRFGEALPHFAIYLLLGVIFWSYFSEVTNIGVGSIVARGDVLRKINFPKYVIVLAGSISALINLAISLLVLAIFIVASGADPHLWAVVWVPLLIIELFVFSIGLAFLLSALFVRFRDINYIWEVFMQGAFYATPIIYPLNAIPYQAAKILIFNPVAQIIQDLRYLLITDHTQTIGTLYGNEWLRLIPVGFTILVAVGAAYYFHKRSPYFAEDL